MGNTGSKTNSHDTDNEGESDYEHAYSFHTKVLHKVQSGGFESDDEDSCGESSQPVKHRASLTESTKVMEPLHCIYASCDGGDDTSKDVLQHDGIWDKHLACNLAQSDTSVKTAFGQSSSEEKKINISGENRELVILPEISSRDLILHNSAVLPPGPPDDMYETATEDNQNESGVNSEDKGNDSDGDSFSTITPPRTRPQSDSECSFEADSESDEEQDISGLESQDLDTEYAHSSILLPQHSSPRRSRSDVTGLTNSQCALGLQLSVRERVGRVMRSHTRKRCASSTSFSVEEEVPVKQQKFMDSKHSTPTKVQYRYPDSDSELDAARALHVKNEKGVPEVAASRNLKSTLTAQTIHMAARQAASRFIRTSRRILKDAKMAARALRTYSSKRQAAKILAKENRASVFERTQATRTSGEQKAGCSPKCQSGQTIASSVSSHTAANQTGADPEIHHAGKLPSGEKTPEVRKNGGYRQKFASSSALQQNLLTHTANICSASVPSTPVNNMPGVAVEAESQHLSGHTSNSTIKYACPSSLGANLSPFQDVQLIPPPVHQLHDSPHGSIDSISNELACPLEARACENPFTSIFANVTEVDAVLPATFTSGSVWARVNMHNNQNARVHTARPKGKSPVPSTSGQRMATRNRPQTPESAPEHVYPRQNTPRVPSLTLSGQFAQSGRFSFLVEDTIHVAVASTDIVLTTARAIVIATDRQLQHTGQVARRVAAMAGPGFSHACQKFLQQKTCGLQECEVLDTPAGGQISQLISHVLHVVIPEKGDCVRQKKMLLCAYLNCLKHADEKLHLHSIAFPLLGAGIYSADMDLHVFFDALLIFLAERISSSPLHAVQLFLNNPAVARFAAEVLEARLETLILSGVDAALADAFQEYFGIPNFSREQFGKAISPPANEDRNPYGKPAIKRRRL